MFFATCFPMVTSVAQVPFWTQIHSPEGGIANVVAVSPNHHVFADISWRVYRTTNSGENWEVVTHDSTSLLAVASCFAFDSTGVIFAGTQNNGAGVFRSTDDGQSWIQINHGLPLMQVEAITVNRLGHIFLAGNYSGIFRSIDDGDNWEKADSGLSGPAVFGLRANSRNVLFAAVYHYGMFRSTDDGKSWTGINNGMADTGVFFVAINSHDDVFAASLDGRVYRSTNEGDAWAEVDAGLPLIQPSTLEVGPDDQVYVAKSSLFRSTDNGNSWLAMNPIVINYAVEALAIDSVGAIYAGTSYGIYRSTDNGNSWVYSSRGLPPFYLTTVNTNSRNDLFTVGWPGAGVFRSTDRGENWTPIDSGLPKSPARVLAVSKRDNLFVTTGEKAYRSTDNGGHWGPVGKIGFSEAENFQVMSDGDIIATVTGTLLGALYRSTDEGASWRGLFGSTWVGSVTVNSKGYIFVASATEDIFPVSHLSRSTDDGISWTDTTLGYNVELGEFAVDSDGVILIGNQPGFLRSTNDGDTWEKIDSISFGEITVNTRGVIFAQTLSGAIVRSTDHGNLWIAVGSLPSSMTVNKFAFDSSGYLYAATWKGLYRTISSTTSADRTAKRFPDDYTLSQNYPNPFNPSTKISYSLPHSSHIVLGIYTVLGQLSYTIVDENTPPGKYTVEFDGSLLSSGVYFYRLDAMVLGDPGKTFTIVKKMVLVK